MELSACIVVYNGCDEALKAAQTVLQYTRRHPLTLYLVDNASPDGSGARLEAAVKGGALSTQPGQKVEVRCRKDPEDWLRRALAAYETVTPLEQSPWGAYWMQELESALSFAESCLQKAGKRIGRDEILAVKYGPLFEKNLLQVQKLMQETTWDGVFENRISDFGRLPVVRSCEDETAKLFAQKLRKDALDAIRSAQRAFYAQAHQVEADLQKTAPAIAGLVQLLRAFDEAFTKEKRRRKLLDFSDLEHETIALLYRKDGSVSSSAREIAAQYREILVDEYQDSNEVQECIFEAVSKEGKNRFLVGDVKQSIYRFRLADPCRNMKLTRPMRRRRTTSPERFCSRIISGREKRFLLRQTMCFLFACRAANSNLPMEKPKSCARG